MSEEELPIYRKVHQLNLEIFTMVANMRKDYKPVLGQNLINRSTSVMIAVTDAATATNKTEKENGVHYAYRQTKALTTLLRLSNDLGIIEQKRYARCSLYLDEILKQAYQWRKSII